MKNTIALYSPCAGCGKTTVAKYLRDAHGYNIIPFAGPLKRVAEAFLVEFGYSRSEARELLANGKETRIEQIGVNVRHVVRTLGTEWGRDCLHPDVWVKAWQAHPLVGIDAARVVTDDCRFPNEAAAVRARGGEVWCIERPGHSDGEPAHRSEGGLEGFDRVIVNDGSLLDLQDQVEAALNLSRKTPEAP